MSPSMLAPSTSLVVEALVAALRRAVFVGVRVGGRGCVCVWGGRIRTGPLSVTDHGGEGGEKEGLLKANAVEQWTRWTVCVTAARRQSSGTVVERRRLTPKWMRWLVQALIRGCTCAALGTHNCRSRGTLCLSND